MRLPLEEKVLGELVDLISTNKGWVSFGEFQSGKCSSWPLIHKSCDSLESSFVIESSGCTNIILLRQRHEQTCRKNILAVVFLFYLTSSCFQSVLECSFP
ncbi:unnamed protein product [Polarella glacialis]|uniref:Uncharacterized protein n=1 Tax=Polarella glacialis TaxID=89957 RepID=A0A813K7W9_POLGL|nr:unnamed protein product [Polarella glacialis]CAE8699600.1 unnamed protein product [Polarella glacialis]